MAEPTRGTGVTLYNRFAELMLVVGLDENTGLVSLRKETDSEEGDDLFNTLFDDEFEAQVLAAISASKALVFLPFIVEDPTYPPSPESLATMSSFQTLRSKSEESVRPRYARSVQTYRTAPINPAVLKQHLNSESPNSSAKSVTELPLSKEAIEAITTFCFPDNAHVYADKPDNSVHFLVLTDVSGSKTYACCLTFYKPYTLTKERNGTLVYTLTDFNQSAHSSPDSTHCFMPQCCVLVSKYPYFYAMKECLSCMISHVERDLEEMYQFLKDFTYTMTMAPVPPAGNVIVEMSVYNLSVSLFPPETPEKPVLDLPLHLVFLCFPIDELLKIFTAILCEERLVFVSSNYALLTIVMESLLYYILPFNWRFTYVPILSASSLELLDAPGTFMMGCNSRHLNEVQRVEGLIVVNIEEGTVSINTRRGLTPPSSLTSSSSQQDLVINEDAAPLIPSLPAGPVNIFKNICKRSKFQMELSDVQRPFYYDIEEERALRMKKCLQFNTEISFAFLEMMVNLFRGTLSYLRIELRRFNKQLFMESIPECDKPFYEKVLSTDMFKQFLEDRLNEKIDYWSDHESRTRPYTKTANGNLDLMIPGQRHQKKPDRRQMSITTFSSLSPRVFEVFRLPGLNDSVTYIKNAIIMLNKTIEECRNLHYRSSYIYLRGMFHAAEDNVESALDDLLSLHTHNARLLPIRLVCKLLQSFPEADREELLTRKGTTHLSELVHDLEHERSTPGRRIMDNISIPDCDLNLEDFVETVSLLDMATDYDTIQRLFLALCQPHRPTHVEKYTFDVLRLSYEENQAQCKALALSDGCLQVNEVILRVSSLIKTDFGMGRIVLTDKRLFFIKDVSNTYREIVKLRYIAKLEKVQYHSFLMAVDALVITDLANRVKFTAWLKNDRNLWCVLIEEMRAGKIVAEATKDFTAIGQAVQNVLLLDAIIRSGQDECVTHYGQVNVAVETLCFFTAYMADDRHNLPKDTVSALQHRVDPNIGQRERKTVEVMLYTSDSNNSNSPRLWCGMGDGKVRVFDATNWTLERSFVQTKHTVSALISVGDTQVWAGSHGIFIIETETVSCNNTLTDHPDLVVDIVLANQGRHAYSASVDGTIIRWELQTLRAVKKIQLSETQSLRSIKLYDNKLWCGTWPHIIALDMEGNRLQTFTHMPDNNTGKLLELDCFEVFNDEIWAGCRRESQVVIWDEKTTRKKEILRPDCRGVSVILLFGDKVWVGTKDGTIFIYNAINKQLWKTIKAHDDAVRSLCAAESRYIMSGAGSKDGKIAIWSPNVEISDTECGLNSD
ncbi:hypothetical protein BsWGS_14120 [Bradybaena similaris]